MGVGAGLVVALDGRDSGGAFDEQQQLPHELGLIGGCGLNFGEPFTK
jgi:hypothetical protein